MEMGANTSIWIDCSHVMRRYQAFVEHTLRNVMKAVNATIIAAINNLTLHSNAHH